MLPYILVIVGALMRLLPHLPNFTPIGAVALFGGVYLKPKQALLVPLGAMILSDLSLGFDSPTSRLSVYGSFVLIGVIGLVVRRHKNWKTILAGSLAGSLLFYLITNFAYFYPPTMYSHNWAGLMASYTNAIPFFRYTLAGDLFYVGALFGGYELAALLARRHAASLKHKP